MTNWLTVDEAREAGGLRLVLTAGVPGPWGEAAKGVFHVKGIPFSKVPQDGGGANPELAAWTGETNAPQAVWNDEAACCGWREIIALAEKLAPQPSLLPSDPGEQRLMLELLEELAGENGFGWSRRLMLFTGLVGLPEENPMRERMERMANRYGYDEETVAGAAERAANILTKITTQWRLQGEAGRKFLIGNQLSALDIYWAAFAALVEPLPHDICPMPEPMRISYSCSHSAIERALDPSLLEYRRRVYEDWLELPIDLGP